MPITYERDDVRRRIVVTTIGIVGIDDLLAVTMGSVRPDTLIARKVS